ncbi:NADPH-dependent oxidoreductase [Lactococcus hircilactis]|uniref:NADPH-dependent oxidoreductase n=1 Tax=Lactococcus hircilactis TaxID=1494462 RepID=A0A7X1Z8W4_9LACT|nr:NADPH-dependent oxidoreductase [Lactococcus hircilactis]MQW40001.1 NADPH-dependent oxidoreductase [Lactococcus hircilactis]
MIDLIHLMKSHTSVRNFTDEKIPAELLKEWIEAGRAASNWKNFQSYSIIIVSSETQKSKIFEIQAQKSIKNCATFLVFVGDLNRAEKAVALNQGDFQPKGVESILISTVDASLAAENVLLAAEAMDYGGVIVGLIRDQSAEISELLGLPDYTFPLFGIALGKPARKNAVKPRLPYESMVFNETYHVQDEATILAYDKTQSDYAGKRRLDSTWSERMVQQWGVPEIKSSTQLLKAKKLL